MWKAKLVLFLISALISFPIFSTRANSIFPTESVASDVVEEEWWIEVEITPKNQKWELNDNIVLLLYDDFLEYKRQNITSWHFFREPRLRFRIELRDVESRNNMATELADFLDSIELVEDHYFAKHGRPIESFDEGYSGERYDDGFEYKRMWSYQKKIWEWGSEMTVEAIRELKETETNDPSRESQLERVYHLLALQLSPGYEMKRESSYLFVAALSAAVALAVSTLCSIKWPRGRLAGSKASAAKLVLLVVGIVPICLLLVYTGAFHQISSSITTLGPEWTLALLNGITTIVLVIITALQMTEARKTRLESVKPSFSLQPANYTLGGGFRSLHLVNGGGVARNTEIDVFHKNKRVPLHNPSIGTGERVPILRGGFPAIGGVVKVEIKYSDSYGQKHKDSLSLDFDSLAEASRKITYVVSPIDVIAHRLRDIKSELGAIERELRRR